MQRISKAVAAFAVAFLTLILGEDVSTDLSVGEVEAAIVALLTALGVYVAPANRP